MSPMSPTIPTCGQAEGRDTMGFGRPQHPGLLLWEHKEQLLENTSSWEFLVHHRDHPLEMFGKF
jgi:hypothetical protein